MHSKVYFGIPIFILHRKSNCYKYHFKVKVVDSCAFVLLLLKQKSSQSSALYFNTKFPTEK